MKKLRIIVAFILMFLGVSIRCIAGEIDEDVKNAMVKHLNANPDDLVVEESRIIYNFYENAESHYYKTNYGYIIVGRKPEVVVYEYSTYLGETFIDRAIGIISDDYQKVDNVRIYMDDFAKSGNISRSNHCAPTAGINLAYYWYNRNNSKYASLMRTSWENSFVILHSLMKTTNSGGTYTKYLASAYQQYFYNYCGLALSKCQLVSSPTIAQMKQEINEGYPFHICVYNHNVYKNHSMLALGYERYYYRNTGTEECYLRVADGWLPYPTRYVYITDSRISKDMIIVRPR